MQQIGVRAVLPPGAVQNTDDLKTIPIATPSGKLVPLGDIVSFSVATGQPEITRENLKRSSRLPDGSPENGALAA